MERHIIPDSENRMILLETLSSIGPLSDTQLLVFVTDLSLMNYFSLHLNLSELEQQGLIEQRRLNDGFVAAFHIVLRHFSLIDLRFLLQKIDCECFLQSGVALIFFVREDTCDRGTAPF